MYKLPDSTKMNLPFSQSDFFKVFESYNNAVWPLQILFNILAALVIFYAKRKSRHSSVIILILLSLLWFWMGIVYHIIFFAAINPAAYLFGIIYIIEAILLLYYALFSKLKFGFSPGIYSNISAIMILYALIIYPLLGYQFGHIFPSSPTFGLPCPTTIFTLAILLLTADDIPISLVIIPVIWSVVGFTAAIKLGVYEDIGLLAAGIVTVSLIIYSRKFIKPIAKKSAEDKS